MRLRGDRPVDPHILLNTLTGGERAVTTTSFEDAEELREALRALPPEQSVPIVLSVYYGLTAARSPSASTYPWGRRRPGSAGGSPDSAGAGGDP